MTVANADQNEIDCQRMPTDASHETAGSAVQNCTRSANQFHFARGPQWRREDEQASPSSDRPNIVQLTGHADRKLSFCPHGEAIKSQAQPTTFGGA